MNGYSFDIINPESLTVEFVCLFFIIFAYASHADFSCVQPHLVASVVNVYASG